MTAAVAVASCWWTQKHGTPRAITITAITITATISKPTPLASPSVHCGSASVQHGRPSCYDAPTWQLLACQERGGERAGSNG